MKKYYLKLPLERDIVKELRVGDLVYLTGKFYTARDQAHKLLFDLIQEKKQLPFKLNNATIYYTGPSPTKPNDIVGSFGPTTASRMDDFAPMLYDLGLIATIGKGDRNSNVVAAVKRNKAVYFLAIGGTGAFLSEAVVAIKIIAYPELGTEAIRKVEVKDFPCYVAIDAIGQTIDKL